MINANELRIGNWVNYTSDISGQTSPIQIDWTWFGNEADQNCSSAIILTPEILEKAGFVNGSRNIFHFLNNMNLTIEETEYDYNGIYIGKIEFLHQLQNLYFWLTGGEELNINL